MAGWAVSMVFFIDIEGRAHGMHRMSSGRPPRTTSLQRHPRGCRAERTRSWRASAINQDMGKAGLVIPIELNSSRKELVDWWECWRGELRPSMRRGEVPPHRIA